MGIKPHADDVNVPPSTVRSSRAPYVLPLFVLIIMLVLTLVAGVYRLSISPSVDSPIQAIPIPLFLMLSVAASVAVFYVLLRFVRARERLVRSLISIKKQLEVKQWELAEKNARLSDSTAAQSAEISERLVELEQSRTAMVSLLEDLTESRDRIEEARAYDDAILRSLSDGLIVVDPKGIITRVNRATVLMEGGTSESEYIGKPVGERFDILDRQGVLVPPDKRPGAHLLSQGADAEPVRVTDFQIRRRDGTVFPIDLEFAPVILNTRLIAVVAIVRDVTEQRRVDRSKSEFVSLASHQLRTPLTAIGWYTELLLSDAAPKLAPQEREYLDEVYRANRRMIELVDALLNVSRIEMGTISIQPSPMDVREFLRDIIAIFAPAIDAKHLSIVTEVAPGIQEYNADRKIMEIIAQNLVSNAIKYTPENGSVTIKVFWEDDAFLLAVSDTGIGIPRTVQQRVFDKLFRADNAQLTESDGSGLGLYLVKSIVIQAGGEISFNSDVEQGTTFTVRLPRSGMKQTQGAHPIVTAPPSAGAAHVRAPGSQ